MLANADPGSTMLIASHGLAWGAIGAILGGIAAVVSIIVAIVLLTRWYVTRGEREAREQRERENAEQFEQLGTMLSALAEEVHGRRPAPKVRFTSTSGPATAIVVERALLPEVDVDAIVANERRSALATLPLTDEEKLARAEEVDKLAARSGFSAAAIKMFTRPTALEQATAAISGIYSRHLPATDEDREQFVTTVDRYTEKLRAFVPQWLEFVAQRQTIVSLTATLDNDGGGPAEATITRLHFPEPCRKAAVPEEPTLTARPAFAPRSNPRFADPLRHIISPISPEFLVGLGPRAFAIGRDAPENVGPFYEDGSLKVKFKYKTIAHFDPIETPVFHVEIPEAGRYEVTTTINAANLPEPVKDILTVVVETLPASSAKVTTLDALLALHVDAGSDEGE